MPREEELKNVIGKLDQFRQQRRKIIQGIRRLAVPLFATLFLATPAQAEPDWAQVGKALGKAGSVQAGGVYRVGFPRTDLKVSLDGVALRTGFAFGGWVAFQPMGGADAAGGGERAAIRVLRGRYVRLRDPLAAVAAPDDRVKARAATPRPGPCP